MGFSNTPLELTWEDMQPSRTLRTLYKSMMNSIIGKFCQRENYPRTKYVTQAEEIDAIISEEKEEIANFQTIGTDICELQTTPTRVSSTQNSKLNHKSNPIITAFVTSLSRIDMHKNILLLKQQQFTPMYTDTDSLVFFGKKENPPPFKLNGGLGYFRSEYKERLEGFCCVGKKSYAVLLDSEKKAALKVCGLSFDSLEAQSAVSFSDFETLLSKNVKTKKIPQTRTCRKSLPFSISKEIIKVQLSTALNFSRAIHKDGKQIYTEPYGYMM